ncbi:paired immunoglobulin-like type 2 receptor beta-2 isoform X2 [Meriones unguiculatus]|uniref:paired immunoglobulin-like type 2 receptor beta-2 isoform X2 n=1 Tax=Meriones unguiculatus TaxID=10047 RepID=UPI00293EA23A|nr:paired immunoglobulin-like type 2 receptor beta-2 isoform X2 [Meriones unguiculatus]
MAWLLLLLLPAVCLQAGNSAGSNRENTYGVDQPAHVSGVQGGSIEIPFSFYSYWELAEEPQLRITWRWQHPYGGFIYDSGSRFIHKHFRNRLILTWTQGQTHGILTILDLEEKDQTMYFCRVYLQTTEGWKSWQSIDGTQLTITNVTTAGSRDTEGQRNPSLVTLGAMVGMVVSKAVLIAPISVLLIFLWRKKSRLKPKLQAAEPVIPQSS